MTEIWNALRGGLVTRALALAAEHDVARSLVDGPRSVNDLATATGADPDVLYRVLRALASDGIFEEVEPRVFANTEASAILTEDGWDDFAHLFGAWLKAVAALDASGEASFPREFGDEFWSWLKSHPEERAAFDRAMAQGWRGRLDRLESVGWRGDETVVDVGGGNGSLLPRCSSVTPACAASSSTCPRRSATSQDSANAALSSQAASSSPSRKGTSMCSRRSSTTGTTNPQGGSSARCALRPASGWC
jgi:hypothetical protein